MRIPPPGNMARIHLFEFEDQQAFPSFLRNYMTDFLQFLSNKTRLFHPILPLLAEAIRQSGSRQLIDLASGGGGGLLGLLDELRQKFPELRVLQTDYYPNRDAAAYLQQTRPDVDYLDVPVDARQVPTHLKGLRTLFLALHHFRPADARAILQNAIDARSGIAIFEGQEHSLPSLLAMFFSPVSVLLTTPFIRPFRLGRLVFTYLIPLVPLCVWWDGIVSSLRTYSVDEMRALIHSLDRHDTFSWHIGRIKSGPAAVLYLIGTAQESATQIQLI
ncbi:hypothetical protein SAMN05421823_11137 [Catalinimonas alkaloidigena]|uniref:Methyltransferase domain-containing protein n=1 Tax=Catalinimonas alkaloidigena TaxID=1075417 RepID=A0A1G9R5D6_9BACT|nr:hypothetical protein [Catalinimonas alkaloidigena]SDM18320.1 hypothetical protein SAMN05421823_11137 [Catalinimonas alkaloidigena]